MLSFLTDELDVREVYKLLIGTVIPRPIALISTLNVDGTINLAAFSSYNLVCSNPASINFSITFKPDGSKKDTLINIEREKEFVISSAHPSMLKQVALVGAPFPYGDSELDRTKFATVPSETVKPPRIQDSLFHFECVFYDSLQVGDGAIGSAVILVGRIMVFHINETIYSAGKFDFESLDMLSRLGGHWYANIGDRFEEATPKLTKK